jgi:Ran GTPase-activating protein (RanGAP) involved in mRNA processing and transport
MGDKGLEEVIQVSQAPAAVTAASALLPCCLSPPRRTPRHTRTPAAKLVSATPQDLLKGNKKLRTLLLRAIGQARTVGMQALAEVMQTNQHLQVLDLSKNAGIKDEGAQKLAYAMTHNNRHAGDGLLSINMSSTSLTAFGVKSLCQGLAAMSSLVAFDLSNSHLDAGPPTHTPREWTIAAAKAIGTVLHCNPGLRFLSLARCHISAAGAGQLAFELDNPHYNAANSALQHLDLGYNPLGEDGVNEVVIALQSHRQLQTLSLAAVNLTTVGLSEVLHQFEKNASLEELDLTHNFIKTVNPKAFASFNANNTTLRRIDLRWNRIEESECAALGSLFTLESKTAALATMGEAKSLSQQVRDLLNLDEEAEEAPYVLCV